MRLKPTSAGFLPLACGFFYTKFAGEQTLCSVELSVQSHGVHQNGQGETPRTPGLTPSKSKSGGEFSRSRAHRVSPSGVPHGLLWLPGAPGEVRPSSKPPQGTQQGQRIEGSALTTDPQAPGSSSWGQVWGWGLRAPVCAGDFSLWGKLLWGAGGGRCHSPGEGGGLRGKTRLSVPNNDALSAFLTEGHSWTFEAQP